MAPPLAGSMNMRASQFLRLDLIGALLYTGSYLAVGFVFSGVLEAITRGYHTFSRALSWALLAAVIAYLLTQARMWRKSRAWRAVPFVEPAEVARAVESGEAVIYDARSHNYYDRNARRIRGSIRLDPNAVHQSVPALSGGKAIYLYCTCVRQATSARIAHELRKEGIPASVIKGGLRGWKKAGLPLEPVPPQEITDLPVFEAGRS